MSASQQKKKRQDAAAAKPAGRQSSEKGRGAWIAGCAAVVVVAVLAVFFAFYNSGFFHRHATAAVVGSHSVSAAEYNFFYRTTYFNSSAPYVTDSATPLSEQFYDEAGGVTWADYLRDETNSAMAAAYALYDQAVAEGRTLSEEDRALVDANLASLAENAAAQNLSADAYLTGVYGRGANEAGFRAHLELLQLASACQTAYAQGLSYSADQIDAYYQENRDSLDAVTYRAQTGLADEAAAQSIADGAQGDEDSFALLAQNAAGDTEDAAAGTDTTLSYCAPYSGLPEYLRAWLTDPARQYGDTAALDAGDGTWTAVMFLRGADQYDANTVNVRHILIQSGSEVTAQDVLDEYLAGEQTEDAFARLADTYSADSGAAAGGLYENVYPGQMVRSFNDWCFDPARTAGDTGLVETDYGTHVLYFVGPGDGGTARDYRIVEALRTQDANAWAESLAQGVSVETRSFGMGLTTRG